ncbi:MAG TPA: carboxyltransferase domain-containing protein [Actinomycetota bacterium]|nr:carboxyltransferase domain-containing protein [Actinomycetota bacterium]
MSPPDWRLERFGNRAVLVRFDSEPSKDLTSLLTGLAKAAARLPGVLDSCPGMTTVLIETSDLGALDRRIPELMEAVQPVEGSLHEVPVTYDGEDFEWACIHLKIDAGRLIQLHSERTYDVRLLGSPGFVYLSGVAPEIALPRLDEPRQAVAAGSVGIAGTQTGIYGRARPGGWRIIARAVALPPIIAGDRVQFLPR